MKAERFLLFFAVVAVALGQRLTIDGALNDAFWQRVPAENLGPGNGGEIRMVVAGAYLYIGARIQEAGGRITARSIGQNPAWEDEDLLRITAAANIGYTDRVLRLTHWVRTRSRSFAMSFAEASCISVFG